MAETMGRRRTTAEEKTATTTVVEAMITVAVRKTKNKSRRTEGRKNLSVERVRQVGTGTGNSGLVSVLELSWMAT